MSFEVLHALIETAVLKFNDFKSKSVALRLLQPAAPGAAAAQHGVAAADADFHQAVAEAQASLQLLPPTKGVAPGQVAALWRARDKFVAALQPLGTTYTDGQFDSVDAALENYRQIASMLKTVEQAFVPPTPPEPLLNARGRWIALGIAALVMVTGAVFAAIGSPHWTSGFSTASRWCAAAVAALVVAACASVSARRRPVACAVPAKADASLKYLVFGGLSFAVLAMLATGFFKEGATTFLSTIDGARGLITFIVAIGTMAIAVILVLASIIMEAASVDELKERLSRGKEILTVLVGVLGTIVGFYFASNSGGEPGSGKVTLKIVVAPPTVEVGKSFSVEALATGGEMPYRPMVVIDIDPRIKTESSKVNDQGVVSAKFVVPDNFPPGTVPYVLAVLDKSGKSASVAGEIRVEPKPETSAGVRGAPGGSGNSAGGSTGSSASGSVGTTGTRTGSSGASSSTR